MKHRAAVVLAVLMMIAGSFVVGPFVRTAKASTMDLSNPTCGSVTASARITTRNIGLIAFAPHAIAQTEPELEGLFWEVSFPGGFHRFEFTGIDFLSWSPVADPGTVITVELVNYREFVEKDIRSLSNPIGGYQLARLDGPSQPRIILQDIERTVIDSESYPCESTRCDDNPDDRLNPVCTQPWQTAAVYCNQDGTLEIYLVGSNGTSDELAFTVSPEEADSIPNPPRHNTLIKQGLGIALYRLTSGQLQINAPTKETDKTYTFIFKDCAHASR